MANLRSKSKARADAKTIQTRSDDADLSEAALRSLPRSELQKLAMAHRVKANMKSEQIIRQLSSLQIPKRSRPAEDEPDEAPSRKKFKRDLAPEKSADSPQGQVALPVDAQPSQGKRPRGAEDHQLPTAGPSAPQSTAGGKAPTKHAYDADLFSGTESEMTEEEQLEYATPVSSRAETPPPANVNDLKRCVTIMQEISAQDVVLLKEVMGVLETAAKLRKKARDVRDLVKSERGRRERMDAYLRYWQVIEPDWDREWLYGKKKVLEQDGSDMPAEPPSASGGQEDPQPSTAVPGRQPASSSELKQRRQAIIAKQEAEQRQLEALERAEMRHKNYSQGQPSDIGSDSERSSGSAGLPLTEEDAVNELLMVPVEDGKRSSPAPST